MLKRDKVFYQISESSMYEFMENLSAMVYEGKVDTQLASSLILSLEDKNTSLQLLQEFSKFLEVLYG